ncbi:hypothetical protein ACFQ22_10250 [Lentilactobacillus raoultii]|uniref:Uncharacterized protein n=1 Tax=Lentilactobacillus raoultii TaxID=1987503 RepID=A0ABW3PKV0_9LACO|nr:hypothetical protein [Lentilactobacillus raoultii]
MSSNDDGYQERHAKRIKHEIVWWITYLFSLFISFKIFDFVGNMVGVILIHWLTKVNPWVIAIPAYLFILISTFYVAIKVTHKLVGKLDLG